MTTATRHLARLGRYLSVFGQPAERRFALAAWLAAPVVEFSLAVAGLDRTLRWIENTTHHGRPGGRVEPGRATELIGGVYRWHVVTGSCLPRSLVQYWLHRHDGTPVRLVIGVRRTARASQPPVEAHAWLEPPQSSRRETPFEPLLIREYLSDDSRGGP